MPREYIYGPVWWIQKDEAQIDEVPNKEYQLAVSVGWSKEDHGGVVQIATVRNGSEGSFDPQNGLYMDLDRSKINDLIKLLRKARDQAYGKDE